MNKKTFLRIILVIFIILWMRLVFGFSNQNSNDSTSLSMYVASLFSKNPETINLIEPYIRKLAHFSEYGLGGVLFFSLFETFEMIDEKRLFFASCCGLLYSLTDEFHQLFVDGRSGQITDVLIDTLGAMTGACVMCFIINLIKFVISKKKQCF